MPFCGHPSSPERFLEERLQAVAFVEDPVVVEAIQKVTAIERHRRLEASDVLSGGFCLESIDVEPEFAPGIELHGVEFAQNEPFLWEATTDVPQRGRERAARPAFWTIAPEEISQAFPGLGPVAMQDKVGQQGSGFERRRLA